MACADPSNADSSVQNTRDVEVPTPMERLEALSQKVEDATSKCESFSKEGESNIQRVSAQ